MLNINELRSVYAKLNKLSNGIDPITGKTINAIDLNNAETKLLFQQLLEVVTTYGKILNAISDGIVLKIEKPVKEPKCNFSVQNQAISSLQPSAEPISISMIANNINSKLVSDNMKKISAIQLNQWLLKNGYLQIVDGNKVASTLGEKIGIITQEKTNIVSYYTPEAQRFIFSKLPEIARFLSDSDFNEILSNGLAEAKEGKGLPINEAFDSIRREL